MSGVGLEWNLQGEAVLQQHINRMMHLDKRGLLDVVGTKVESQFRHRIEYEKTAPDGTPWQAWSDAYARTRHAGQSLLESELHLLDGMTHVVMLDGSLVEVGSNMIYAAMQNFGGAEVGKPGLPARELAGLSTENKQDIRSVSVDWLDTHWLLGLPS